MEKSTESKLWRNKGSWTEVDGREAIALLEMMLQAADRIV